MSCQSTQTLINLSNLVQNALLPGVPGKFEQYQALLIRWCLLTCAELNEDRTSRLVTQIMQIQGLIKKGETIGIAASDFAKNFNPLGSAETLITSTLEDALARLTDELIQLQSTIEGDKDAAKNALNEQIWEHLISSTIDHKIENNAFVLL